MGIQQALLSLLKPGVVLDALVLSTTHKKVQLSSSLIARLCTLSLGAVDTEMLHHATGHLKTGMTSDEMIDILLFLADDSGRMRSGASIEIISNMQGHSECVCEEAQWFT